MEAEVFDLTGVIDLHLHSAPDLVTREYDDFSLASSARAAGYRAIVIKSHWSCTAARAQLVGRYTESIMIFGGVVLNWPVGGLNPNAVEACLRMGGKVVWLPTLSSARHLDRMTDGLHLPTMSIYQSRCGGIKVLNESGRLKSEVIEIIDLVADSDAILATGHISPVEIEAVVRAARDRKVERILVTHPEHPCIDLPLDIQLRLARLGAVFERCYASTLISDGRVTVPSIAAQIRAVGCGSTILSTDLGATGFPRPVEGMRSFLSGLRRVGIAEKDLDWMVRRLPAQMLGIP
jgi:hypothetical protein